MNSLKTPFLSGKIADFVTEFRFDDAPRDVVEHGKMLLTDTFGVAMFCTSMEHAVALKKTVKEAGGAPECTLWGGADRARMADAVLYNAGLIHGADYDDTHVGGVVHPSAAVVSAAIAAGEFVGASGREILEAMIVGWEIIVRLALAARGGFHDAGYHCTGIVAPFAAACTAAKLMKLPKEVLINALGICGSQAAGIQEFLRDGTWAKKLHPGWGAHSAFYALSLAGNGFTGPGKVFEGDFGLWKTHLGRTEGLDEAFSNLKTHFYTPEITFKMYPVCHMTHSFIDGMLSLRDRGVRASNIETIECRIEPRCYQVVCEPRETKVRPRTDYAMRFSLPYVVAIAAARGQVSSWEIDMKYASNPEIQDLMDRVHCVSDESKSNPGFFPGWLRLTTKDGHVYTEERKYERGSPENPIAMRDVRTKFEINLGTLYTTERKARIMDQIGNFDKLASIGELLKSLETEEHSGRS